MKKNVIVGIVIVWISIFGFLANVQAGTYGPTHSQPQAKVENADFALAINFYSNPKLSSKNYVLNDNEEICANDFVSLSDSGLAGEWFAKGGVIGTPPVAVVSNARLNEMLNTDFGKFSGIIPKPKGGGILDRNSICTRNWPEYQSNVFPELTLYPAQPFTRVVPTGAQVSIATVICAPGIKITSIDDKINFGSDSTFQASENNSMTFKLSYAPECYLYTEGTVSCGSNPGMSKLVIPSFKNTMNFEVTGNFEPPSLEIVDYSITDDGIVRMQIKNIGGMNAQLDDIKSNYGFSISNKPLIKAGETKEVFGKLSDSNIDKDSITFNPVYRATELGCLSNKQFGETFVGGCVANSDCESGLCCVGKCRDATKGFCDDLNRDGTPDTWTVFETS